MHGLTVKKSDMSGPGRYVRAGYAAIRSLPNNCQSPSVIAGRALNNRAPRSIHGALTAVTGADRFPRSLPPSTRPGDWFS